MTPPFKNVPETWERPDWALLQSGYVSLFWSVSLFAQAKSDLIELGYRVVEMDAGAWDTTAEAFSAFGDALNFPDYYGHNMGALADCLSDVATYSYGSDPTAEGTVVALDGYRSFTDHDSGFAWKLLDILADTARQALLIGHRFLVIARSDNPDLRFPLVGGTPVLWNRQEWQRSNRG